MKSPITILLMVVLVAGTLSASDLRLYTSPGSGLYQVDPTSGAANYLGIPRAIRSIASHPLQPQPWIWAVLLGTFQSPSDRFLARLDPLTLNVDITAQIQSNFPVNELAIDPVDGQLYGASWPTQGDAAELYTIDPATGTTQRVGALDRLLRAMGFNDQGQMIAADDTAFLSIDKHTAQTNVINSAPPANWNGMSYDPVSQQHYGIGGIESQYQLFVFDDATGDADPIGPTIWRPIGGLAFALVPEPACCSLATVLMLLVAVLRPCCGARAVVIGPNRVARCVAAPSLRITGYAGP